MSLNRQPPAWPTCHRCGARASNSAYVCWGCERKLAQDLVLLGDLFEDATLTVARLDRHGGAGGGRSSEQLPVNLPASDRVARAAQVVCATAREVAVARQVPAPGRPAPPVGPVCAHGLGCPHRSCFEVRTRYVPALEVVACRWLVRRLGWLRHRPYGPQLYDQLGRAARQVAAMVDVPPQLVYRGPCEAQLQDGGLCEGELYARPGADWVACRACGAQHDLARRRAWLDQLVRTRAYTAAEIAAAYPEIRAGTVRQWAARGRLVSRGDDPRGRPRYPLGEVLDLAAAEAGRRATAQARRARHAERRRGPAGPGPVDTRPAT